MSWEPEIAELNDRIARAQQMGGPDAVARQHQHGKLSVRERITQFADTGSFAEFMGLTGSGQYEGRKLIAFTPKPTVDGSARINGRKIVLTAGDFTIRGGTAAARWGGFGQEMAASQRALAWQIPYVRLLDAAGASVRSSEEASRTYLPDGDTRIFSEMDLLSTVPVASAVLGSVAGMPAISALLSHFNVIVKGIGHLFPGGPPVVKAALGYDVTKENLGGSDIHTTKSGSIDNVAEDEQDAFRQIRTFLSYLPGSVFELAPRSDVHDDPNRAENELLSIVPRNSRHPYDARKLVSLIVDKDSFFEIAGLYGRGRLTGLARVNGYPIGIMANDPRFNGGSTDVAAGSKVCRLIQLCDTFHLPLVSLADEPGFTVGLDAELQGIERAGARLLANVYHSRMPWITFVIRRLFGMAGQCHHRSSGLFQRFAWPSASWGSMHVSGGVSAAYRREIEAAPDPDKRRREIEERLNELSSPFRTAEATGQDIIDPRQTRSLLCEFVADAQRVLATQLGAPRRPYIP